MKLRPAEENRYHSEIILKNSPIGEFFSGVSVNLREIHRVIRHAHLLRLFVQFHEV